MIAETYRLSLCQENGSLKARLEQSISHLPIPVTGKKNPPLCQLHHWAHCARYGDTKDNSKPTGSRANVMICESYGVVICLRCFYHFHPKENLHDTIDCIIADK